MTEKEIIQAWKKNEKAWMFMSDEMKDWANIHQADFVRAASRVAVLTFQESRCYQLINSYPEPTEYVECEVYVNELGFLAYEDDGLERTISGAVDFPNFIGFKYEDGMIASSAGRYNLRNGQFRDFVYPSETKYKVLTPTHVLFERLV